MKRPIVITAGNATVQAELLDNPTGDAIWEALPVEGKANVWGEEIYFDIPVTLPQADDAREEMAVGELAYWPTGKAFCIFFGPTPVSAGDEPRAYSPVNVFGRIVGDVSALRDVPQGAPVRVIRSLVA